MFGTMEWVTFSPCDAALSSLNFFISPLKKLSFGFSALSPGLAVTGADGPGFLLCVVTVTEKEQSHSNMAGTRRGWRWPSDDLCAALSPLCGLHFLSVCVWVFAFLPCEDSKWGHSENYFQYILFPLWDFSWDWMCFPTELNRIYEDRKATFKFLLIQTSLYLFHKYEEMSIISLFNILLQETLGGLNKSSVSWKMMEM